jgi:hypothetical protein
MLELAVSKFKQRASVDKEARMKTPVIEIFIDGPTRIFALGQASCSVSQAEAGS